MRVCVYAASSAKVDEHFHADARALGEALARGGCSIVYGGGSQGLMGSLADGALSAGGEVVGILPKFMADLEWGHPGLTHLELVEDMRELFRAQRTNLVNASIRAVNAEDNALSYAPEPAFSVVLYITQSTDADGNARMARLTSDLIDLTARHGGRFFLPYQLHYTPEQLRQHYPEIGEFFAAKRRWDPAGRFTNTWYERYSPAFAEAGPA